MDLKTLIVIEIEINKAKLCTMFQNTNQKPNEMGFDLRGETMTQLSKDTTV